MKKRILSIILSVLICFTYFAPMSLLAENETIDGSIEIQDELIQEEVDTNDNLNEDLEDIVLPDEVDKDVTNDIKDINDDIDIQTSDDINLEQKEDIKTPIKTKKATKAKYFKYRINDDGNVVITDYIGKAKNVVIPRKIKNRKVVRIGLDAFYYNEKIISVTIPNTVTSIGGEAFGECYNLKNIILPNSLKTIGWFAFEYCTKLETIDIPKNVKSIGCGAFSECDSLTSINVDKNNPYYKDIDGVLFSKSGKRIVAYPFGKPETYYEIPSGVTTIDEYLFSYNKKLKYIILPNSVTKIGDGAFEGCAKLTSMEIPGSIKKMGYDIFFGCDSLTEVTFGEGIKKIEEIFGFCKKLKTVNLPSTIDKIYGYCFYGCENLTTVSINENNKKYKKEII